MRKKWRLTKNIVGRKLDPITRERNPKDNPERRAWLHTLPCAVKSHPFPGATPCAGEVQVHHPTGAGMGLKDDDNNAFPLCRRHHTDEFHPVCGSFRGWVHDQLKKWQRDMTRIYRLAWCGAER